MKTQNGYELQYTINTSMKLLVKEKTRTKKHIGAYAFCACSMVNGNHDHFQINDTNCPIDVNCSFYGCDQETFAFIDCFGHNNQFKSDEKIFSQCKYIFTSQFNIYLLLFPFKWIQRLESFSLLILL